MSGRSGRELPPACEIWTALSVGREPLPSRGGDRLLFDNGDGGSGQGFDWSLVARSSRLAAGAVLPAASAPHNARAAQRLGAYAIDVGSSVDASARASSRPRRSRRLFDALRPRLPAGGPRMRLNGRFGRFGGCYVPEILVPALEQLEARVPRRARRPGVRGGAQRPAANYAGRPTPLTRCRNLPANIYLKREDLLHGGAHKTNQVLGPGAARQAHGQNPADRRDRRRPAWGRHRNRRCAARLRDSHLHGRRGRRAAEAERLPDAADGRDSGAGRKRRPNAQGRDQRSAARLVGELRDHPLSARHGSRPAPVPDHGPRVPAHHRPRGAGANPRSGRAACRMRSSPASAAARTRSACSPTSSRTTCG